MSFWREVFDGRDEAQTPARDGAAAGMFAALGVLAVGVLLVLGAVKGWSYSALPGWGSVAVIGFSSSIAFHLRRRRQLRQRHRQGPPGPRFPGRR